MADPFYPSVDIDFIIEHANASGKLAPDGLIKVGSTTTFVQEGTSAIYRRSTLVRELQPGQVCLEQAIAVAFKFGFLKQIGEWLEENRDWKDGGYIDPTK
jgi:hypothetical protein